MNENEKTYNKNNDFILTKTDNYKEIILNKIEDEEEITDIKDVIKYCDKFVLLATDKAIESFWCNWELGFGDTHKYIEHIAILPIKEKGTFDFQYKGNEYLQIYPQIDYYPNGSKYNTGKLIPEGYYVRKPKTRTITPLKNWLNKRY
jgi:hypothetical protein